MSAPAATLSAVPGAAAAAANPMLTGPLLPVLTRLALPTVVVMFLVTVLSVAETYFVSVLGTDAVAAAAMVVPVILLMTMVANGGIGGGVSSAIARARGAGRPEEAESLAWHALPLGLLCGALFTAALWTGAPALYAFMGGHGAALEQAVRYSNILFTGAMVSWALTLLQAALRGAGNVKAPALNVAGAGVAQVITNVTGLGIVIAYMRSRGTTLQLRRHPWSRAHAAAILGVGLPSSLNAAMTNLSLTAITAAAGSFGIDALAGYGIASRLDALLVPILFGFGTAAVTVVALWPALWMGWFTHSPAVLEVGSLYLYIVAPTYGLMAIAMELYFASQGARRIGWPVAATTLRLAFVVLATVLAARGWVSLGTAFAMVAAGTVGAAALSAWGFRRVSWSAQ